MPRYWLLLVVASVCAVHASGEPRLLDEDIVDREPTLRDYNEGNARAFLARCSGSVGVGRYEKISHSGPKGEAASAGCIVGSCPDPIGDVLTEGFLQDFYREHCCVNGGRLYVAFFADGRRDWTYLFGHEIPQVELTAACLGDGAD